MDSLPARSLVRPLRTNKLALRRNLQRGGSPNSRLLVVNGVIPNVPELKHPETGPSRSIRRAGLRNNKETSAGRRIATDKTSVSILLLAAVMFFQKLNPRDLA
jgi:hypothetical protein